MGATEASLYKRVWSGGGGKYCTTKMHAPRDNYRANPGDTQQHSWGNFWQHLGELCGTNVSEHRDFSCLLAAEKTKSLSSDKTGPENRSCAVGIP